MSPNQYVADLRAERDRLRAFAGWLVSMDDADPYSLGRIERRTVTLARIVDRARDALSGDVPVGSERLSTDSDPAATERPGEAEGAGDGV